jgi:hypothetical protein
MRPYCRAIRHHGNYKLSYRKLYCSRRSGRWLMTEVYDSRLTSDSGTLFFPSLLSLIDAYQIVAFLLGRAIFSFQVICIVPLYGRVTSNCMQ